MVFTDQLRGELGEPIAKRVSSTAPTLTEAAELGELHKANSS
ncbi:hypothetical protein [Streptomyces sp. MK5]